MTARRLANLFQCDVSTATSMIARLEKRGLVRSVPHPTERSPFARLDHESTLRLHAVLREVIDGPRLTGEAAGDRHQVRYQARRGRADPDLHRIEEAAASIRIKGERLPEQLQSRFGR
ncbi:MarR family transcriptional regulator [Streptomyces niveus]|uniref:MarR family transcriptional regulator n=1 Tax=Streptomyces niveus TaxID=193462 RepID=UPI00386DAF17|nr:MarR family transcriptional regulator [Streptomyces niveus]